LVCGYFGSNEIGDPEIEKVRHAILDTGVLDEIDRMVSSEQAHAEHLIESLGLPDDGRAAMMALLQYNTTRSV
jgi:geranylgeranyl pyrophosphate synthase